MSRTSSLIAVRVSITDQLTDANRRREVQIPRTIPPTILSMRSDPLGTSLPAVIGLRSVLEVSKLPSGLLHQWKLTVSPDNPSMRRRFLSDVGTMVDDGSGSLRGRNASYSMIQAFEDAHAQLSDLGDPQPLNGTTIQLWFGYHADGKEFFMFEASSLLGVTRDRERIEQDNLKRKQRAQIRFPFTSFVIWERDYEELVPPRVPSHDEWKTMHNEGLVVLFNQSIKRCMQSLWKAVYASEQHAQQLREHGFPIDKVGKTFVSDIELRKLIERNNRPDRHTYFYNPDEDGLPSA